METRYIKFTIDNLQIIRQLWINHRFVFRDSDNLKGPRFIEIIFCQDSDGIQYIEFKNVRYRPRNSREVSYKDFHALKIIPIEAQFEFIRGLLTDS